MNGYIYYDTFQEAFLKTLSGRVPRYTPTMEPESIPESAFRHTPIVLVVIAQPSETQMAHLAERPWSKIFIRKGVRFPVDEVVLFTDVSDFDTKLATFYKAFEHALKESHHQLHDKEPMPRPQKRWFRREKQPIVLKGLYTISGNSDVAAELAKTYARQAVAQKVLIVDGDLHKPSLDRIFGIDTIFTGVKSHLKGIDNTGLNIFLDAIGKRAPLEPVLNEVVHRRSEGLDVMLGNYNLYNIEHYEDVVLKNGLESLTKFYDVVFVSVNTIVYDTLSLLAYHVSNKNVFICDDQVESIRFVKNILEVLQFKQHLANTKQLVAVQRNKKIDNYNKSMSKKIFGKQFTECLPPIDKKRRHHTKLLRQLEGGRQ